MFEGRIIEGDGKSGHVIAATAGTGANKQTYNYSTERVVGNGSFGVVFQATWLEGGETVRPSPGCCPFLALRPTHHTRCTSSIECQKPRASGRIFCNPKLQTETRNDCPTAHASLILAPLPAGGHQEGAAGQAVQEP